MDSVESQGVVYSASFDIPYAIGSVAIPLPEASASSAKDGLAPAGTDGQGKSAAWSPTAHSTEHDKRAGPSTSSTRRGVTSGNIPSVRRCTHHRFCYLRDGSALEQDIFYRWLLHQQSEVAAGGAPKHDRRATAPADVVEPSSPSLLYASLDCVVFLLPGSFAHPRRVVRQPPYLIEDDTWADHMVEVQLHFLPHLRIPPVMLVHQVLLERRTLPLLRPLHSAMDAAATAASKREGEREVEVEEEEREVWVPQLLASTFGKPKLPPVSTNVVVRHRHYPTLANNDLNSTTAGTATESQPNPSSSPHHHHRQHRHHNSGSATAASTTVVVTEKVDTLRLYHPSVGFLQHARCVLTLSSRPVLRELHDAYEQLYPRNPTVPHDTANSTTSGEEEDRSLDTPFLYAWSLPYEAVVAEYAAQRASTAVAVLQAVLGGLKRERAALEETCRRSMHHIAELTTSVIPEQLREVHSRCLKLYRKE
ncbi:hypothetical protein ABB37_07511 [Leptomonas pyrrhocoris]|uniref:YEATS domain-containing protein n=1 Tax=Leptomonas pyrrhocoris TaxID=157538 RepID=A0A0M9FV84_LEPPY|nr:hypothetical protein ABB37_07511 [Leptomonas pyrrhocoris]KPA76659.1 hypothetical protein ABB37_07511 [Leptomonas pyrrhocoris]|eukprot:XP_015655098.1 hypothetical protein ABB37_07511 [Leptomonas pyrrhocoris]